MCIRDSDYGLKSFEKKFRILKHNDKNLIYQLIIAKNSKDKVESFSATAMLNYLKNKGVEL
mgnify:CR=1 FL=1